MNASRAVVSVLASLALMILAGCTSPKADPVYTDVPDASGTISVAAEAGETQPAADAESADVAQKPEVIVTPDDMLAGTVVSVNDVGRFVVLRFPPGRMATEGSTLHVYRQGLKVAELKVTGPQKDDHTVADIRTGDCRPEDEVRDR